VSLEVWIEILDKGAVVALAVFAILSLQREYKRQLDDKSKALAEGAEERQQLIGVIERNTEAWAQATQTMTSVAAGIAMLTESVAKTDDEVAAIRVLLARRPCVGEAIQENEQ
jgi:hypothetical protein